MARYHCIRPGVSSGGGCDWKTEVGNRLISECADSGVTVVVEMPDQRLVAIHSLDPQEDDSLIDELLASDPKFQASVAKSKAGRRKPFSAGNEANDSLSPAVNKPPS